VAHSTSSSLGVRQTNHHFRAARIRVTKLERGSIAVQDLQSRPEIGDANAAVGRTRIAVELRAVVLNRDEEVSVVAYRRDGHRSSEDAPRDPVLDGVLRQRLEQQVRNQGAQQVWRNVQASAKTLAEANLLNLEIALQVVDLLAERHLRSMRILRGAAQELAE